MFFATQIEAGRRDSLSGLLVHGRDFSSRNSDADRTHKLLPLTLLRRAAPAPERHRRRSFVVLRTGFLYCAIASRI